MRLLTAFLIAILPTISHAQIIWTSVAAPATALVPIFQDEQSQISNHTWMYPFTRPIPAGIYEVRNAIVDKSQKIGAWSKPATLVLKSGWHLYGGSWNQSVSNDDAGVVWKVRVVLLEEGQDFPYNPYTNGTELYYYSGWDGSYPPNTVAPYSGNLPRLQLLTGDAYRLYRHGVIQEGGRNTTIAPPPVCYGSGLTMYQMEIAWCRVSEAGETELSPSYQFKPPALNDGWTMAQGCDLTFSLAEQHPQGTLGYHVYVKLAGAAWQRVPAPQCYGEPQTPDDWLFQWNDRQPVINRLSSNPIPPTHYPVTQPKSRLNTLQVALKTTGGNVQVNANAVLDASCPVIDEYRASGNKTYARRIASKDGGRWTVRQVPSLNGYTSWPVLAVENHYSQWIGCEVQAHGGSALAFSDFSGGQAFGNRFIDCNFFADPYGDRVTCGVLIDSKCSNWPGGHTASELKFYNTKLNGVVPVWIAGNQTANIRFSETNMTSLGKDRRASAVYLECPNQVVFSNGLNVDCPNGGALLRAAISPAKLLIEGIWVDQGASCVAEACGVSFDLKLSGGKLNVRGSPKPTLARYIDQRSTSRLTFTDLDIQPDPGVLGVEVVSGAYNLLDLRFTDTLLADIVTLREPTKDQVSTLLSVWWYHPMSATDVPEPGLRLGNITFNSLTGRQNVLRSNWTE